MLLLYRQHAFPKINIHVLKKLSISYWHYLSRKKNFSCHLNNVSCPSDNIHIIQVLSFSFRQNHVLHVSCYVPYPSSMDKIHVLQTISIFYGYKTLFFKPHPSTSLNILVLRTISLIYRYLTILKTIIPLSPIK